MFQAKRLRVGQWVTAAVLTGLLMVTIACTRDGCQRARKDHAR